MSQRRRYRNPPIDEALCEFRFRPGEEWDLTVPGKLQAEISGDYTGKPQDQRALSVAFKTSDSQPQELAIDEGLAKVQLRTDDGKRIVAVGRDVLSVHMLRPYQIPGQAGESGWDEFRPRIERALEAYWNVCPPQGISRIGVRYINKILPPSSPQVEIKDYLNCAPAEVEGLPSQVENYLSRIEYRHDDDALIVLSHGTIGGRINQVGFLLDIDVISETVEPLDRERAMEAVELLRVREREAFELLITDKAREHFDAD